MKYLVIFVTGTLDESQNFLFIPLLHSRGEVADDLEEKMSSKSVLVIFETLSYFPGEDRFKNAESKGKTIM